MRNASTAAVMGLVFAAGAALGQPLFPQPLHLTREIADPVTGRTTLIEEYFSGDRAVSIAGDLTGIVDYGKGESVRIDRSRGTFSITSLDALARAARAGRRRAAAAASEWDVRETGTDRRSARAVTVYRAVDAGAMERGRRLELEVAVDRSIALTRGGAEVLAGAAYPSERSPVSEAILRAAGGEGAITATATGASSGARFGLPVETILTWRDGDEEVRLVNRIVRIGRELAPAGSLEIPRGARKVEDPRIAAAALLEELDQSGRQRE